MKTLSKYAPVIFVLLWSTGFIAAKYILPYAEPFVFLTLRYGLATLFLVGIAKALKEPFRIPKEQVKNSIIIGLFLQVIYIGGVYYAISLGVSAGVSSVVVSMQPILVSLFGITILKESIRPSQSLGLILGFLGVFILLNPKIFQGILALEFSTSGIVASVIALIGTSMGYLLQKRLGSHIPFLPGTTVQFTIATLSFAILSWFLEEWKVQVNIEFIAALSWAVLALSIGSIFLLFFLLKRDSASSVSSLYYLVPSLTALQAFLFFGERIAPIGFLGLFLAVIGTFLVTRKSSISMQS